MSEGTDRGDVPPSPEPGSLVSWKAWVWTAVIALLLLVTLIGL